MFAHSIHRAKSGQIVGCENSGRQRIGALQQFFGALVTGLLLVIAFDDQFFPKGNIAIGERGFVALQAGRRRFGRQSLP